MNKQTWFGRRRCARAHLLPFALLAGVALGGCDGENLFPTQPIGGGEGGAPGTGAPGNIVRETVAPTVTFRLPATGSTVAVGDSVFVEVGVRDNEALASLELKGIALRGSRDLGTEQEVARFAPKKVEFPRAGVVRDTAITRFLLPAGDTLQESRVFLVAIARDTAGNAATDTLQVAIGGPRVQITTPSNGLEVRAGVVQVVRVNALDRVDRVRSIRLRVSGATTRDTTLTFNSLLEQVDTAFAITIPANVSGEVFLDASAVSSRNIQGTGRRVALRVLPPATDQIPPTVSFSYDLRGRVESSDTVTVDVSGTDNVRLDSVGVTVVALRWNGGGVDTLAIRTRKDAGSSRTFRFGISDFGIPAVRSDTMRVTFEVTAFARDASNNCASATVTGVGLAEPCRAGRDGATLSDRSGSRSDVLVVRGQTVRFGNGLDQFVDLVSDGRWVYLSNIGRSRVEVVGLQSLRFERSVRVGSQPWGLALNPGRTELLVANSGGTNISRVPIRNGVPDAAEDSTRRIYTPNIRLYDVTIDARTREPSAVVEHAYSDRPQFLAQTQSGDILYSTKPTSSASAGTLRRFVAGEQRVEFFIDYAFDLSVPQKAIVVNARSAALVLTEPKQLSVCPQRRPSDTTDPACIVGPVDTVFTRLVTGNHITQIRYSHNIELVGLSDTTYAAVSGDHRHVLFGEGRRDPARAIWITQANGTVVNTGLIRDLINNASERVTGLGLNFDGTLAVARGSRNAYFFNPALRLQGVTGVGSGVGGVDMHPGHAAWPATAREAGVSFVAGVQPNGMPYIDLIDTFHFDGRKRIFLRDEVTGPVRAVRYTNGAGQQSLRVFAITAGGLVAFDVESFDVGTQ